MVCVQALSLSLDKFSLLLVNAFAVVAEVLTVISSWEENYLVDF